MNDARVSADCIFCRIIRARFPSRKVHEDEDIFAFHDVRPQAPVHFLIFPRITCHAVRRRHAQQRAFGRMLALAGELARKKGDGGFRTIINTGGWTSGGAIMCICTVLGGSGSAWAMILKRK